MVWCKQREVFRSRPLPRDHFEADGSTPDIMRCIVWQHIDLCGEVLLEKCPGSILQVHLLLGHPWVLSVLMEANLPEELRLPARAGHGQNGSSGSRSASLY